MSFELWLCDRLTGNPKISVKTCRANKERSKTEKLVFEPCIKCRGVVALNKAAGREPITLDLSGSTPLAEIPKFHDQANAMHAATLGMKKRIRPGLVGRGEAEDVENNYRRPLVPPRDRALPGRMIDQALVERVVAVSATPPMPAKTVPKPAEVPVAKESPTNGITVREIAAKLGLTIEAARQRVYKSRLKAIDEPHRGTAASYDRAEVEEWLKSQGPLGHRAMKGPSRLRPGPPPKLPIFDEIDLYPDAGPAETAPQMAPQLNGSLASIIADVRARRDTAAVALADAQRVHAQLEAAVVALEAIG